MRNDRATTSAVSVSSAIQPREIRVPSISVVIPTFCRETSLLRCLKWLAACRRARDIEVIVVDQTPNSCLAKLVEGLPSAFSSFCILDLQQPNISAARNAGALTASAPILLFLDDDVDLDYRFLEALTYIFAKNSVDLVGGAYYEPREASTILDEPERVQDVEWLPGANIALRRDLFFAIRGFDENLTNRNEDMEFCYKCSESRFEDYPLLRTGCVSSK